MITSNRKKISKFILTTLIIVFLMVVRVDASCTTSEKSSLKQEATNIEFIEYLDDTYDPLHNYSYGVYINNLTSDFYIVDSLGNRFEYSDEYSEDSVFGVYTPGSKVTFEIYGAYGKTCSDELLRTTSITFDYYNDYSTYEECEGIEEFYLCKRNYSGEIESEEWFLEQVEGYKNGTVENIIIDEEEKSTYEDVVSFLKNHIVIVSIVIVIIILLIIYLVIKLVQRNKNTKVKIDMKSLKERGDK